MATLTEVHTRPLVYLREKTGPIKVEDEVPAVDLSSIPLPPPTKQPEVLSVDQGTPDHHVPRDPRLIRLTGVHPFNVEPPLTSLFNEGTAFPVFGAQYQTQSLCSQHSRVPDLTRVVLCSKPWPRSIRQR